MLPRTAKQAAIARYKSQQQQTRKNEEFAALHHEIEHAEKDIVTLEDSELELMEAYDKGLVQVAEAQKELEKYRDGDAPKEQRNLEIKIKEAETTYSRSKKKYEDSVKLLEQADKDLKDGKYENAARKRLEAMQRLRGAFAGLNRGTAVDVSRARDLPAQLRDELRQSAESAYPAGYEALLRSYYKKLSTAER